MPRSQHVVVLELRRSLGQRVVAGDGSLLPPSSVPVVTQIYGLVGFVKISTALRHIIVEGFGLSEVLRHPHVCVGIDYRIQLLSCQTSSIDR